MESFHWDRHFETGIATVDEQHHGLVDMINRFGAMLIDAQDVGVEPIEVLFTELASYAQYHFEEEEDLMDRLGLDPRHVQAHRQAHADFVRDVTVLHEGARERGETAQGLLKFLTYWLAYHILGSDQAMAAQVRAIESGQSAPEAYQLAASMHEGATEPLLQALNGLFEQVSQRNRALMELNSTLEAKVAQRTASLSEANHLLEQMALTDVLTGLPNRRHAMAWLEQAWAAASRNVSALSCIMIDADGFKQVNDRYGHEAGDEVLRQLARHLRYSVRTDDTVCRLGGDEFLIICPGTGLEGALQAAEATRQEISKLRVDVAGGGQWVGSVSMGVASRMATTGDFDALLKIADDGLYIAKRQGRNCVASGHAATPELRPAGPSAA